MKRLFLFGVSVILLPLGIDKGLSQIPNAAYLSWTAQQAEKIGKATRSDGRVGGRFDLRVIHTERAYNYKLRATWLTPEIIRATARLEQIRLRLTEDQTKALVAEAEGAGQTVFLVEIDPREGSGVIPLDWHATLQPKKGETAAMESISGVSTPQLKNVKALAGVVRRDYSYDVFWVVFALVNDKGAPVLPDSVREVQLVVSIYDKEGTVSWSIPDSIRQRTRDIKLQN